MEFDKIIEMGIEKAGTQRALCTIIEQNEVAVSECRKKKRGLPNKSCAKLAQFLGMQELKVIAAKEEWVAKTKEDREFWHPLANAAGIAALSVAFVTTFLTPSPAQAAQTLDKDGPPMCIMSNMRRKFMRLAWAIRSIACGNWQAAFDNYYFADHTTPA